MRRLELNEHLNDRLKLIGQLAERALHDTESSDIIMHRIQFLREEADVEKVAFDKEMKELNDQLEQAAQGGQSGGG